MLKTMLFIAGGLLFLGIIFYFIFKRNYFNKHKYVRYVVYKKDKSINISYIKKEIFAKRQDIKINSDHIFNYKGYTTVVSSDNACETINPLDFTSKYDKKAFVTAINAKVIQDTFQTLAKPKIDLLMVSVVLNGLTLAIILYFIFMKGGII